MGDASKPAHRQAWSAPALDSLVERPSGDAGVLEIWCYTDRFTYRAGESVEVRVHTTAPVFSLTVVRDGARPITVRVDSEIPGAAAATPEEPYVAPLDWPIATSFEIEEGWTPGLYLLIVKAQAADGQTVEGEHFIVIRASGERPKPKLALVLTTSTMLAYNDWGGANHYRGLPAEPWVDEPAPVVSARRPVARGMLRLPADAPRHPRVREPGPMEPPQYRPLEYALEHGYTRHYPDAFWANYERHFVVWAENAGYELDYLTQHDLHFEDGVLDGYDGVLLVGHDEYWTWEMRDAVDGFVDVGGMLIRLGGNIIWQVRLSDDGAEQTCFKLPSADPFSSDSDHRRLTTTSWDWEPIGRPTAETFGVSGLYGCFNRFGAASPRASGGLTVYRPGHWAFEGTGLVYGDQLGAAPASIAGFEVDGLDYTFRAGLPYPTHADGAPESVEILAMTPAVLGELDDWGGEVALNAHESGPAEVLVDMTGDSDIASERRYGAGMMVSFERGSGCVFNTGTTEWVNGLVEDDPFIDRVTRNALDHAVGRRQA